VTADPAGHSANLLGAVALAVHDRMVEAVADEPGGGHTAVAALSALDQFLEEPSIDRLAQVVGLSPSGAVRLVDRLQAGGLVVRGSGTDGRTTTVGLTAAGRRRAQRVERSRLTVLDGVLAPLTADERETLAGLLGRLLVGMMREPGATRWMCRLCDLAACGRAAGQCPVEREARARYGGEGGAIPSDAGVMVRTECQARRCPSAARPRPGRRGRRPPG
jgi:DNA-binding MarR family transcriptional regulator